MTAAHLTELPAPAGDSAAPATTVAGTAGAATQLALPLSPARPAKKTKRRAKPTVDPAAPVAYTCSDRSGRWVFTLRFPAPDKLVSANARLHWRAARPIAKTWREAVYTHARAAALPVGLVRVRIDIELRFPTGGRRDASNYYTAMKPVVDAFGPERRQVVTKGPRAGTTVVEVGHGLIPDDTAEYLDGPYVRLGPVAADKRRCPFGEVVVTITDLTGEVAA